MTCERCCAWPRGEPPPRPRRCWTVAPCNRRRNGYDGAKRKNGAKVHVAVDTLGHLLARHVTPANVPERRQVGALAEAGQAATGQTVEVAIVDQGSTGAAPAAAAAAHGIQLEVVKLPGAKKGFVPPPRRWVVARSFAWTGRFRRLARDDERLHTTREGFHSIAVALLALKAALPILGLM
jgi:transposase